ncbi:MULTISPECIES: hypothetical protein [Enterobacterales]|jgi:hypothetical protein|uniref:Uncharacterized protein n=1 Tax=Kluyvera cryocrescens TaxID=580 RepID=A0AAW9C1K7_KLUCR|nr:MULTISPECIES: hypothetical protein [Enterobacterales]ELS4550093.1 hypothetical protein [Klebsiella michiganensis]MDS0889818.1 hypothetical protein [Raoultella ornithinolytica]HBS2744134.1 hypothetical protein [Klebsiella quasipneumoniae subsp. quasipneumoniae]HCP9917976.1 hypothetical protein [Escherichia coli]EJU19103.1 hypothetical protein HMPREF1144_0011 [Klebsiella sp. OBRC7]
MTKQILPNELAEIVTGLLVNPVLLGELDSREAHQNFMQDIGRVVADYCGGRVNGITDGDVTKAYLSEIECTPCLHIEPDERLPSTERNVWSNYHVEAWSDEEQINLPDAAIVQSERETLQTLLIVAARKESAGAPVLKRMTDWRIPEGEPVCHEADRKTYTAIFHLDNQTSVELVDEAGQHCLGVLLEINHGVPALHLKASGGDVLLHIHAAQGGLVITPDNPDVKVGRAELDRYAYEDKSSLLVKTDGY